MNYLNKMLSGYKTYICSALIVVFAILYVTNVIDMEVFLKLLGIFGGLGLISMRQAIAKIEK